MNRATPAGMVAPSVPQQDIARHVAGPCQCRLSGLRDGDERAGVIVLDLFAQLGLETCVKTPKRESVRSPSPKGLASGTSFLKIAFALMSYCPATLKSAPVPLLLLIVPR